MSAPTSGRLADAAETLAAGFSTRRGPAATRLLLGVVGPPGVGKSTFAEALVARLTAHGSPATVLPMDGFHLPQAELVRLGRRERMGAPDTFDVDGFVATLAAVRADDGAVRAPLFDRAIEEPVPGALTIGPEVRIAIVEGNYLLHDTGGWERVGPLLDAAIALEVPEEIRLDRLVARHVASGKTPEAARAWATGPDAANARLIAASLARWPGPLQTLALD
ncbi:MAG: hypothetical protein J0G30_03690 [Actinomycetales bacterium]|nr:hypothetical protein [Actinomycetales bacterium]